MHNTLQKVGAGIATTALLALTIAPAAFADDNVFVGGNGAFSDTNVHVSNSNSSSVSQTNTTNISNNVTSRVSTGGNSSSFNTGGSTAIVTGDANSNTTISNEAGSNVADLSNMWGSTTGGANVAVSGNGAFSNTSVSVSNSNHQNFTQSNRDWISNQLNSYLSTGKNASDFNTSGDSFVNSGGANVNTMIHNAAGSNMLSNY